MTTNRTLRNVLPLALWVVTVWTAVEAQGTGAAAPQPVAAQSAEQIQIDQIERGRATVSATCVGCHAGIMRMLAVTEKPREEWRDTIHSMIGRGAQVLPDEIEPLTEYLVARAGPQASSSAAPGDAGRSAGPPGAEAVLAERCELCHDIETATARPASEDWAAVLDRMVLLGASVTPAERQTLIEYLDGLEN